MGAAPSCLVIACGALAREITALMALNDWPHLVVQCLPADFHNRPEKIVPAVRAKIIANRDRFASIFVAYADCGTGGQLDTMLAHEGVERIPGAHCYEFYAGAQRFEAMSAQEPGTFYLTDFLLRHFDRLVVRGLGIEQHPELLAMYFGNYQKLTYLAQVATPERVAQARDAARRLGLAFEVCETGYGALAGSLAHAARQAPPLVAKKQFSGVIQWQN